MSAAAREIVFYIVIQKQEKGGVRRGTNDVYLYSWTMSLVGEVRVVELQKFLFNRIIGSSNNINYHIDMSLFLVLDTQY